MSRDGIARVLALAAAALLAASSGCGVARIPPVAITWAVGQAPPEFDPQGPPDAVRWALERLLSRGLVDEDTTGRVVPACAESVRVSTDGLVYTFVLRDGLAFTDGTPCRSPDFRRALEAGLNRVDHGTAAWLLGALVGMDRVRPGRPLPPLGIATPDERTLVLRLARPDPLLTLKLALPGMSAPWTGTAAGEWRHGVGDYRVESVAPTRMTLIRRPGAPGADTVHVRFAPRSPLARALMREGACDLAWPLAPGVLDQALPAGYRLASRDARPPRRLLLVLRADLAPTAKAAARHALAHALSRADVASALGPRLRESADWLPGAGRFDFPRRDAAEVRDWLERGGLGRSVHAVMAYARDGVAAEVARGMQTEWARVGLDVELRPLGRKELSREALRRGGAQILLVEEQPLVDDLAGHLAPVITPARGPAIGAWRSGWVTREFDAALRSESPGAPDAAAIQRRLAEEHVVIPLGRLPWLWVEREGGTSFVCHPRFGPDPGRAKGLGPRS